MSDYTVFDIETTAKTPWRGRMLVAGIGDKAHPGTRGRQMAGALLARPGVVVCHTSFDMRWMLLDGAALHPGLRFHDTRVMAWLLDEEQRFKLEDLMMAYLGREIVKPIVQRANVAVWSTAIRPIEGETRAYVPLDEVPTPVMQEYNREDLEEEGALYEELRRRLKADGKWDLFLEREVPLIRSLARLEAAGLPFDGESCEELRVAVQAEADELEVGLVKKAGVPGLNLGSAPQMARLLFTPKGERVEFKATHRMTDEEKAELRSVDKEHRLAVAARLTPEGFKPTKVGRDIVHGAWVGEGMGLAAAEHGFGSSAHWMQKDKKHKQPSTSSVSLVLANPENEFVASLVYWRELDHLANSFLSRFPTYANGGRMYGTVARTGTVTGRFSSSEPNLQNIPAHGTYGALVRGLFVGELVLGDYAQLEQRIATHYCQDPRMLEAYATGTDLYGLAASVLFGGEADKKHPQRGLMKTGMLGIQYGSQAGKLAQLVLIDDSAELEFNVTGSQARAMAPGTVTKEMRAAAQDLMDQLKEVFPVFFAWREEEVEKAIVLGHVETLSGRYRHLEFPAGWRQNRRDRRRLDNVYPADVIKKGFAMERQAINALCQGGAADVVAGAMVAVDEAMGDEVRTLVQVHDEMVWERLAGWTSDSLVRLQALCESGHGYDLSVPLVFEPQEAASWAEKGAAGQNAHGLFVDRMKRNRSEGLQSRKASDLARTRARAMKDRSMGNGGAQ